MSPEQARKLGKHLRNGRQAKGVSAVQLGEATGINQSTILRFENGEFTQPGPDKLTRISKALDLNAADVLTLAGYSVPAELPSLTPYLRTKYQDLPEEEIKQIESYVARKAKRHGIKLDGPEPGEDEQA